MALWNKHLSVEETREKKAALDKWLQGWKKTRREQAEQWRREMDAYLRKRGNEPEHEETNFYDFIHEKFLEEFKVTNKEDRDYIDKIFGVIDAVRHSKLTAAIFDEMYEEDDHLVATAGMMEALCVFC
jgi:hypothetical protein